MTKWEYKTVTANRSGKQEETGLWTYTSWELLGADKPGPQPFLPALQELGGEGWELAAALPSDVLTQATRTPNASHVVRTITYSLPFKRPVEEAE